MHARGGADEARGDVRLRFLLRRRGCGWIGKKSSWREESDEAGWAEVLVFEKGRRGRGCLARVCEEAEVRVRISGRCDFPN